MLYFRHSREIARTPRHFQLQFGLLNVTLNLRNALYRCFLCQPDLLKIGVLSGSRIDLLIE